MLEEGTLEPRKELPRGFVHEIRIDPDTARGVITFYELPKNPDRFGLPAEARWVAA